MTALSDINDYFVFIDKQAWEKAKSGNEAAKKEIKEYINGLRLYFHVVHPAENQILVSLDDLIKADIIRSIIIYSSKD